jgi:hypothetical protein
MMVKQATVVYSVRIDSDMPDMALSHPKSTVVVGYPSAQWLLCEAEVTFGVLECIDVG